MSASDISKAIKRKTDAQLRLKMADKAQTSTESPGGTVVFIDPSMYTKPLVEGNNVEMIDAGGTRIINAKMGILAGPGIAISDPNENGEVVVYAENSDAHNILGKPIVVPSFDDKDGYVVAYSALNGSFYLKQVSGGGVETLPFFNQIVLTLVAPVVYSIEFEEVVILT